MEKRLIDADALIKAINQTCSLKVVSLGNIVDIIGKQPTVEAVPRWIPCKECIYYQDNNGGYPNADCKWCKDETPDANDYCSCGERNEKAKGKY